MSFLEAEEENLINLVANHPVLYDVGDVDYRNNVVKDKVWKIIGKELNKDGEYDLHYRLYIY